IFSLFSWFVFYHISNKKPIAKRELSAFAFSMRAVFARFFIRNKVTGFETYIQLTNTFYRRKAAVPLA
ncbi:MAG: hypothetical protein FWC89_08815, partial [Defluviitaleaceae bacterium]|nr:hypothetical protein [Defluviitaleaceae bacterium]